MAGLQDRAIATVLRNCADMSQTLWPAALARILHVASPPGVLEALKAPGCGAAGGAITANAAALALFDAHHQEWSRASALARQVEQSMRRDALGCGAAGASAQAAALAALQLSAHGESLARAELAVTEAVASGAVDAASATLQSECTMAGLSQAALAIQGLTRMVINEDEGGVTTEWPLWLRAQAFLPSHRQLPQSLWTSMVSSSLGGAAAWTEGEAYDAALKMRLPATHHNQLLETALTAVLAVTQEGNPGSGAQWASVS
jgi:hypothetical protein